MDKIVSHPVDAVGERIDQNCEDGLKAVKALYEILGYRGDHTQHLRKLERVLQFMKIDAQSVLELAKDFEGEWVDKDNRIYDLEQQLNGLHD